MLWERGAHAPSRAVFRALAEHRAAQPQPPGFGVRGLVRAFGRRLVAVERERGVPLFSRPAERGPALATSRPSGKSGDKSPHSKILAGREDSDGLQYRGPA